MFGRCNRVLFNKNSSMNLSERFLSTNNNNRRLQQQYRGRYMQQKNGEPVERLPEFTHLLRNLYKRAHPDLLRHSHPEFADINDKSIQVLNGVLDTVKATHSHPPQTIVDIPFNVKSLDQPNVYETHTLRLRLGGGYCKKQLTKTFEEFFLEMKLTETGKFEWNKEYFPEEVVSFEQKDLKHQQK